MSRDSRCGKFNLLDVLQNIDRLAERFLVMGAWVNQGDTPFTVAAIFPVITCSRSCWWCVWCS